RNPTHRRPIRAQNGACATAAYPADCPKRAFELPIRRKALDWLTPLEKFAQLVDYHMAFETVAPHV
ncbi:hypothetical protein P6Z79_006607, partial [Pseudomonas aeruginosa]|uniref:hypothetical protein n=2 Tax=Pseudomonas aeruginosa TaxID=287 RepID=UPI0027C0EC41